MHTSLHAVCLCEFFYDECSTLTLDSPSSQVGWLGDAVGSGCLGLQLFAFLNGVELTQHSSF